MQYITKANSQELSHQMLLKRPFFPLPPPTRRPPDFCLQHFKEQYFLGLVIRISNSFLQFKQI